MSELARRWPIAHAVTVGLRVALDEVKRDEDGKFSSSGGGGGGSSTEGKSKESDSDVKGKLKGDTYHPTTSEASIFAKAQQSLNKMHGPVGGKELEKHVQNAKAGNELRQKITAKHGDVRIHQESIGNAHRKLLDREYRNR